jgi:hypothetical protein
MTTGEAYGFFDCDAEKDKIEALIPTIRKYSKIPSGLKHYLAEDIDEFDNVPDSISKYGKEKDLKYVLKVELPDAPNNEVGHILNQVYQSPLFKDKDTFRGEVVYIGDKGKLVEMEDGRYL